MGGALVNPTRYDLVPRCAAIAVEATGGGDFKAGFGRVGAPPKSSSNGLVDDDAMVNDGVVLVLALDVLVVHPRGFVFSCCAARAFRILFLLLFHSTRSTLDATNLCPRRALIMSELMCVCVCVSLLRVVG